MLNQSDIQKIIYTSISYAYFTTHPGAITALNTSDKLIIAEAIWTATKALTAQVDTEEKMTWFLNHLSTYKNKLQEIMSDKTLTEYEAFQHLYKAIQENLLQTQEEKTCST